MSEMEKIEQLRKLLGVVQDNTKREFNGRDGNSSRERSLTSTVLKSMLGREPSEEEIKRAQAF